MNPVNDYILTILQRPMACDIRFAFRAGLNPLCFLNIGSRTIRTSLTGMIWMISSYIDRLRTRLLDRFSIGVPHDSISSSFRLTIVSFGRIFIEAWKNEGGF